MHNELMVRCCCVQLLCSMLSLANTMSSFIAITYLKSANTISSICRTCGPRLPGRGWLVLLAAGTLLKEQGEAANEHITVELPYKKYEA
jgi:hypothetical protein